MKLDVENNLPAISLVESAGANLARPSTGV
jgi:hypothetical protein